MSSISSLSGVNGYTTAQPVQYTPPVHKKDDDTQRYQAAEKAKSDRPAVNITLSPEAQKALAEQQTAQTPNQTTSTAQ